MSTKSKILYIIMILVSLATLLFVTVFAASTATTNASYSIKYIASHDVRAEISGGVYVGGSSLSIDANGNVSNQNDDKTQTFTTVTFNGKESSGDTSKTIAINKIELIANANYCKILFKIQNNAPEASSGNNNITLTPTATNNNFAIKYYDASQSQWSTYSTPVLVVPKASIMICFELNNITTNLSGLGLSVALASTYTNGQ